MCAGPIRCRLHVAVCACLASLPAPCVAAVFGVGDIAFIGFNGHGGNDDFSVVLLADVDQNQVIHFNDNEWTYKSPKFSFDGISEGGITWKATSNLPAGTVLVFTNTRLASTLNVNLGVVQTSGALDLPFGKLELEQGGDTILAYSGDPFNPTSADFLAAISNKPADYGSAGGPNGTLTGTGLTEGTTALQIFQTGKTFTGGEYRGPRSGLTSFTDYKPLIQSISTQWLRTANGEDVLDPTTKLLDATPFTILAPVQQSVPEAETYWLFAIALTGLWLSRRRY